MESTILIDLLKLFAVALLVLGNGFFVAAEFSLVSVRKTRIAELVARGEAGAETVQKAISDPDSVIAATQLGITLSSLALGWIGEPALSNLILPIVELFPADIQSEVSHTISAFIAFSIITFLHVVIGELAPKSIALQNPERTSLAIAQPTLWAEKLFKPAIWVLNGAGNWVLRVIGIDPAAGHQLVHSVEELKMIVDSSAQGGAVEADERELLVAVFAFGDLLVRQVMIPRTEIIAVEADTSISDIISLISESTYTKFPVFEDNLDNIQGIVHVKDLLNVILSPGSDKIVARDLAREPIYVPETAKVNALLRQMRDNRRHIAIVLDEYGGTAGMVTLEDLLEELVGEVSDPFDKDQPEIQTLPDGSSLIDGLTLIEDVNEKLGVELHNPDYDTIAGYVMGKLGRIPKVNDMVEIDTVRFRVEEMDGMRIDRLSFTRLDSPPEPKIAKDSVSDQPGTH
jgi:CBS domain containing-hemolysin-like protein